MTRNKSSALYGLHRFDYARGDGSDLICYLDFSPAERGGRENGQQMEPDHAACMTLHAAFVKGVDISELLSADTVSAIEAAALADYCKAEAV